MKYKDYYETLGVPRDATEEQIKKSYRKLARANHPDVAKEAGAEERFKDIAEAYNTLKDPEKRAAYDALGRRPQGEEFTPPPGWGQQDAHGGGGAGFGGGQGFSADDLGGIDLEELFAAMGRGGAAGGAQRGPIPRPGRDYEATVTIDLADAHRGATRALNLQDEGGERTLEVTIPAGVREGQKLRLRGKGGKGRNGGPDGDIYLHIAFAPHPMFRPDGHDLYFDLALAPWEAALGADVEVPTLDGAVTLAVPAGTRSGRKLRLRGRGLAKGTDEKGDLYAVARVDVPTSLTSRERELFGELAKESRFNPRAGSKEA